MELKLPILSLFTLVVSLNTLTTINSATGQNVEIPVRVGVVVDMGYTGQMGLVCIQMALSEFYAAHNHFETRLLLSHRDSNRDIVGAAAAALDLLKNEEVQAIIGPLTSEQTNFVINLGDKAHVPVITFSATSPSLSSIRSSYFIRATLNDSSQVQAIGAIIQAFGWRQVVPIYVDNEFGEGIIPSLTDALEQVNAHVPYRSVIPPSATDDQIAGELYKLMTMPTRVFVVHMRALLGRRLFAKAKQVGMMSKEYVWIITDGIANELNSIESSVMESMLGVIGVRPHFARTEEFHKFEIRYKKTVWQKNPTEYHSLDLSIYGLWAYDSAIALALAVEKARVRNATFLKANTSSNWTDLERIGVSSIGPELIKALSSTTFRGLAGKFELIDGQLQTPPYEIVNVVGPRERVVSYWTKEMGIIRQLIFTDVNTNTYTTSNSNIAPITWPGDRTSPPKGWVIPTSGKKLRIGVPVKYGFFEFLKVTSSNNTTHVEGYSKDVFDAVIKSLPYSVQYEYIPFSTSDHTGSYNDLVYQVYKKNFDGAVGDIAIVANRSQYVDFTLPYTQSGVSMVVPVRDDNSKKAWVFLKPLTKKLWVTTFCSFVLIGFLIWILEHRINEDFRGPPWEQLGVTFWFAFSTMVFTQKERVISNMSRIVLIIWFLVVLILIQSYTASLTSMLTVQQMQPTVTDVNELIRKHENVGYQEGSFVYGLLIGMHFEESNLKAFKSTQEMDELFTKGTANGGIAAAFDDIPCLKIFLANYCSKYTMVGPTYKTDGFGFIFQKGSPLVTDISGAILKVTQSTKMMEIEKKWLGNESRCSSPNASFSSNSLALESFWGLFMIVWIVALSAFIIYVVRFLHQNWHVVNRSDTESTTLDKILELIQSFYNRDLSYHAFRNIEIRENRNCCGCDCTRRVEESLCTNAPPSPILPSPEQQNGRNLVEQDSSLQNNSTNVQGGEIQRDETRNQT
ncbi:hypothetical protein ACS0TY_012140 [Phlomoides rotata]